MAEVLGPIIQQSGSMTMLHSPADAFQKNSSNQSHHSHSSRSNQMPRTHVYNSQNGAQSYRGTSAAPVAPYAFQATPQLRPEQRTSSAPSVPVAPPANGNPNSRQWHASHASSASDSTASTASTGRSHTGVREDGTPSSQTSTSSRVGEEQAKRNTASGIQFSSSVPDLSLSTFDSASKPSPDRYRRAARRTDSSNSTSSLSMSQNTNRSTMPSGSGMANVAHLYNGNVQQAPSVGHTRGSSVDDLHVPRQGVIDQAKRYRRRSVGGFDGDVLADAPQFVPPPRSVGERPPTKRQESHEARPSSRAGHSSHAKRGSDESVASNRPSSRASSRPASRQETPRPSSAAGPRQEQKSINIPPRGSSDANKRLVAPSPLSRPMATAESDSLTKPHMPTNDAPRSPAMQHLTALNDGKVDNKGMKSRLRRAFSFGSAAELRRASAENNLTSERAKLRKENPQDELDPEDAAIAAKQEAAGIGAGIYSGQGGFSGSTDNLSISSTASSASIMLRKMGKGMKKGGRSIKGLFRPKSVIGVPAADHPVMQPSMAQVSMVTVEAEREKVNVNADPHDQVGGGTAYPKLERNSIDAGAATDAARPGSIRNANADGARKSIMGGDRDRAEILAGIKKGILKRPGTASPVIRPVDAQQSDSAASSAPSTPKDDHTRPAQLPLTDDYFNGLPRFGNSSTKSLPNTPQGSRNISFSPRLQFHDAWSSTEYDRRGDVATCNRLTPMLAQQIKEELNTFKMEMEVHEASKPHTHFF